MKNKEKFTQVLHRKDYGEMVLVVNDKDEVTFVCKLCKEMYILPLPVALGLSKDFIKYIPELEVKQ
jgi:hypothetical protein